MRRLLVALAVIGATLFVGAPRASADQLGFLQGVLLTMGHPNASPPGANDWACQPSVVHPYPVVLVHGTFGNMSDNMGYISKALKAQGYCVYALNYGGPPYFGYTYATGPVKTSAHELATFVDKVLAATGASKVDFVGHSQGGMLPRAYTVFENGASKTHTIVGLSPSNHGTSLGGLAALSALFPNSGGSQDYCAACTDQTANSPFMKELNAGGDTLPGINYTVIETQYDEVVTPYKSAFLNGASNLTVQKVCGLDFSEHLGIAFDPIALRLIENALDPAHAKRPACTLVLGALG